MYNYNPNPNLYGVCPPFYTNNDPINSNGDIKMFAKRMVNNFKKFEPMKKLESVFPLEPNKHYVYDNALEEMQELMFKSLEKVSPNLSNQKELLFGKLYQNYVSECRQYIKGLNEKDNLTDDNIECLQTNLERLKESIAELVIMNQNQDQTEEDLSRLIQDNELKRSVLDHLKDFNCINSIDKQLKALSYLKIEDDGRKESLINSIQAAAVVTVGCAAVVFLGLLLVQPSIGVALINAGKGVALINAGKGLALIAIPSVVQISATNDLNCYDIKRKKEKIIGTPKMVSNSSEKNFNLQRINSSYTQYDN